ncbi:MAG: tRNA uridine-5-carboxymethylaminomethyl(34) synthesis enzyme MnmG, partial [Deltaproteobacteria bacterium]|nr:tRNA uridine-5-carboxymethylaminomethyl(34) synthesis enzyme MnmG [Deltaproteobacteria bacterium]
AKREAVENLLDRLNKKTIKPEAGVLQKLKDLHSQPIKNKTPLVQLLRRNDIFFPDLRHFDPGLEDTAETVAEEVENRVKYEGYILRQERQVEKLKKMENLKLPEDLNYEKVYGLTTEAREKLSRIRPISMGQASRISGITPAALMALHVHLKRSGLKDKGLSV